MKHINVILELSIPIDYDPQEAIKDIYNGTFHDGDALEECADDIVVSEIWIEDK